MKQFVIACLLLFTVKLFAASPTLAGTNSYAPSGQNFFQNLLTITNGGNIYSFDGQGRFTMTNPANGAYSIQGTNGHYKSVDQYGNLREWTTNRFTVQTSVGGVSKTLLFSNDVLSVDGVAVATSGVFNGVMNFYGTNNFFVLTNGSDTSPVGGIIYQTLAAAMLAHSNTIGTTFYLGQGVNLLTNNVAIDNQLFLFTNCILAGLGPNRTSILASTNKIYVGTGAGFNVFCGATIYNLTISNIVLDPIGLVTNASFIDVTFHNEVSRDVFYPNPGWYGCRFENVWLATAWDSYCNIFDSTFNNCYGELHSATGSNSVGIVRGDRNVISNSKFVVYNDNPDPDTATSCNVIESTTSQGNQLNYVTLIGYTDPNNGASTGPTDGLGNGFGRHEGFTNSGSMFTFFSSTNLNAQGQVYIGSLPLLSIDGTQHIPPRTIQQTNVQLSAASSFTWQFGVPFINTNYSVSAQGSSALVSPVIGVKTTNSVVISFTSFSGQLDIMAIHQ